MKNYPDLISGKTSGKKLSFRMLEKRARALGFDAFGVAKAEKLSAEVARLRTWLNKGYQAGMGYLERNLDKREDITLLVDGARSVIVTLTNYYTDRKPAAGSPVIARYAYGKDYHRVVKERLKRLMNDFPGRCFVDSAPVLEHEWARRAGLGWIGRNTLLIHRKLGSFCFIGIIVTPEEMDVYSSPVTAGFCGQCTRCVDACPTGALTAYEVNAGKCISYHTIENKGEYPEALKRLGGNRIFGCDACQDVCPWNRKAIPHRVADFEPSPEVLRWTEADWKKADDRTFERLFKDTPLERAGREKIIKNLG